MCSYLENQYTSHSCILEYPAVDPLRRMACQTAVVTDISHTMHCDEALATIAPFVRAVQQGSSP